MKVVSAEQMREMDRRTIEEFGVPGLILMENAALRVVESIVHHHGPLSGHTIAVVCGKGNNGGDGFAVARHLTTSHNCRVSVWLCAPASALSGDAAVNHAICLRFGIEVADIANGPTPGFIDQLRRADLIVDALLGTGIRGPVTGPAAQVISAMNDSGQPIVAIDIPSGLDANTGAEPDVCVRARTTVTFACPKYGLMVYPGAEYAGTVDVVDIGMPPEVMDSPDRIADVTMAADVARILPTRGNHRDSNKGKFGHAVLFCGSAGYLGAAVLCAGGAIRAGSGLVTLGVPEGVLDSAMAQVNPVAMTRGLPQTANRRFGEAALDPALALASQCTASAIGPGIAASSEPETARFVAEFIARCPVPLVVDADALTALAQLPDRGVSVVHRRNCPTIFTPHPGEMGRLLGMESSQVQADRRAAVQMAAERYGCIVLLKGSRTLIAAPGARLRINLTGNPGMAAGGSGDALTGVICALLANRLDPLDAAAVGASIHGLAGDLVASRVRGDTVIRAHVSAGCVSLPLAQNGAAGMTATDLIERLPDALSAIGSPVGQASLPVIPSARE